MLHILPSEIASYFSTPGRAISTMEFLEFWDSLTLDEKDYYKNSIVALGY
jgi:hypothetical protein